jgi:hypothetical protein
MTLLGKIFTVLIFIMSVLFMGFSVMVFATHKNWKMLVTNREPTEKYPKGLVPRLEEQVEANTSLRKELEELQNQLAVEQAARRHAIGTLEQKLADARHDLSEKEAELRDLRSEKVRVDDSLNEALAEVKFATEQVKQLREDIRTVRADRDQQFDTVVQLTDRLNAARGLEQNLEERRQSLLADLARYKKVMDRVGLSPDTNIDGIAPQLDGVITAVGEKNLIEVSLGWDDGLRVGHRLEVFRDNTYLGHATVLKTDPDRAVAKVDEKSQRGLIKVQDRVATKLTRTAAG